MTVGRILSDVLPMSICMLLAGLSGCGVGGDNPQALETSMVRIDADMTPDNGLGEAKAFYGMVGQDHVTVGQYATFLNAAHSAGLLVVENETVYSTTDSKREFPYCAVGADVRTRKESALSEASVSFTETFRAIGASAREMRTTLYGARAFCEYLGGRLPSAHEIPVFCEQRTFRVQSASPEWTDGYGVGFVSGNGSQEEGSVSSINGSDSQYLIALNRADKKSPQAFRVCFVTIPLAKNEEARVWRIRKVHVFVSMATGETRHEVPDEFQPRVSTLWAFKGRTVWLRESQDSTPTAVALSLFSEKDQKHINSARCVAQQRNTQAPTVVEVSPENAPKSEGRNAWQKHAIVVPVSLSEPVNTTLGMRLYAIISNDCVIVKAQMASELVALRTNKREWANTLNTELGALCLESAHVDTGQAVFKFIDRAALDHLALVEEPQQVRE